MKQRTPMNYLIDSQRATHKKLLRGGIIPFSRFNFLESIRTYSAFSNDGAKYLFSVEISIRNQYWPHTNCNKIYISPHWKIFNQVNYYACPVTKMKNVLSLKGQSHELRMRDFLPRNTHGVISRHYRYWVIYVIFKSETAKSNVFPLRKVNL